MAITSMRGYGGQNAMLMRNESISDSLVAMLGSCSSSPRHLAPPGVCGGCIDRSQTCCGGNLGFNAADFCWILGYSASRSANVCMYGCMEEL